MTLNSNDEDLFPDTEIAVTGMTGQPSYLQDEDTTNWYTADDPDSRNDVDVHWGMQNPSTTLQGTQNVYIYVRHTGNDTNTAVDFTVDLYENGTQVETVISGSVSSTSGTEFSGTFDASSVSNESDTEFFFSAPNTGGMPGTRDVAEVGYLTWGAGLDAFVSVVTDEASGVGTSSSTLNGTVDFAVHDSVDVWFEWGQVGNNFPNSTTRQALSSPQSFNDTISVSESVEYEFRAHVESADASQTDQGSSSSFWSRIALGGTCTLDGNAVEGAIIHIVADRSEPITMEVASGTDGSWSADAPGGNYHHVAASYDDGIDQYNEFSYPFLNQ